MSTAGPNICGTGADSGARANVWDNPQFITANDGQFATCPMASGESSNELQASNFNFSISSNATILGIQVDISKKSTGGNCVDNGIFLFSSPGAGIGNDKSLGTNWPATVTLVSYGSGSDLWGLSSAALLLLINTSDFGVGIAVAQVSSSPTAAVDYVQMTITYSVPGSSGQPRIHIQNGRSGYGPHKNWKGPVG